MLPGGLAIIFGLATLHLSVTVWWWPGLMPWLSSSWTPVTPTANDAFVFWLLSLPVGFVVMPVMPGNIWLAMLNSFIVGTLLYIAVWRFGAVLRVMQQGLISETKRRV